MGKDLNLDVKGSSIWWLSINSGDNELKEIHSYMDALAMALAVNSSNRKVYVLIRVLGGQIGHDKTNENDEVNEEDSHLEGRIIALDGQIEENEVESDLCDSSYRFSDESEEYLVDGRK